MPIYPHSEGYINGGSSEDPRLTELMEEMPDREVFVKNTDDTMIGTGMLLLEDNTLLAPEGFGTESGSINFGDLITLSEASGFLAIQNNLNGNRYRLVDHFVPKNAPSSTPGYVQMYEAENKIEAQALSTTVLNANPLIFNYTTKLMSRVNSIGFKANTAMTNVRIKITALGPNIVVKYYPSKASWVQGTDGVNLSVGENLLDFKDTPLLFEPGEQLQFEIRANAVSLLGNPSGVPYLSAMVQRGQFKYLANADQVPTALSQLSNDAGYLTNSTLPAIPSKTSDLTNDSNFITSSQAPVQSVNGQSGVVTISIPEQVNTDWNSTSGKSLILNKPALSTVAVSGSYSDLSNKPTIPTNTNQLTNGSGFVTASQAASSAPVQSVNGQQGAVTLSIPAAQIQSDWNQVNTAAVDFIKNKPTIPSVVYPVTSVNGKTGAVVLVNTDVGAAATSHTHVITDVTDLQTALNAKISVGASIPYSTLSGTPTLSTVATSGSYADLSNKPSIPAPQVNSDWSATTGLAQILNKPTTVSGYGITDAVTQTSLTSSLSGYATTSALTAGLSGKANTSHTHVISDVTNLQTSLDSKFTIPTGTTAQYVRGNGSLATFPTTISSFTNDSGYITSAALAALGYRRTETFLGTSDASGNYTITFAGTYATAPDVQPQIIGGSFNQFVRVVSVSTTSAVVQVAQRNTVTLLSVEVLLGATVAVAGASVSVQVTARA